MFGARLVPGAAEAAARARWLVAVAAVLWLTACSAASGGSSSASSGSSSSGQAGGGAASSSSSGSTGTGGDIGLGGNIGTGGSCQYTCSGNLKDVIGCSGQVVQSCSGEQACLNGQCTNDPCGAAEAAKSSYGCDYWAAKPDLIGAILGACFTAIVANTWSVPVHIEVGYGGQPFGDKGFIRIPKGQGQSLSYEPYDPVVGLPVGEVAMLFLAHTIGPMPKCPAPPALNAESGIFGTGRGKAFHITTDRPVVAYQIIPYGGGSAAATSATLLLPTSAWDTNYVAVNAYQKSQIVQPGQPSLGILAGSDGTEVKFLPKVQVIGGPGVPGSPANQAVTYQLGAGEYVQISQDLELTGSPILSNQPVGLWGGASCLNVPVNVAACDGSHQQIPPVKALGSEYVGVRYRNRKAAQQEEAPPWRLVGAVKDTLLTWQPGPPPGAPETLQLGQVAEMSAPGPFVVRSQDADHPFYLAAYMTGGSQFGGEGDPEWVNVVPTGEYLDHYVFFTDPTYSETNLVLVRRPSKIDGSFADVSLACAGVIAGWQAIGDFELARVDLVTGDFQNVGGCSNGRQEMSSALPFGVTVWGWGGYSKLFTQYVSYAYPAGASVQPINEVVVPPVPK
ncbi:MAG: IgGFc-binding protein [Deltaproteobacteria bacterium]|nr:IgGFc-binding protein [Deltaproteobacteria bacterium]